MNAITRFTKYTTQSEPVITVGLIAAMVLAILAKYFTLTEDDLELLGLILVPIVGAVIARLQVYSPATVAKIKANQAVPGPVVADPAPEAPPAAFAGQAEGGAEPAPPPAE